MLPEAFLMCPGDAPHAAKGRKASVPESRMPVRITAHLGDIFGSRDSRDIGSCDILMIK